MAQPSRAKAMALRSKQLHEDAAASKQLGCLERAPAVGFQKALHIGTIHSPSRGSATGLSSLLAARVEQQEERTALRRERTAALHASVASKMEEQSGFTPPLNRAPSADAADCRPRHGSALNRVVIKAAESSAPNWKPSPPLKRHGSSVNSVASVGVHAEEVEIWATPGTSLLPAGRPLLKRTSTSTSHSSVTSSSVASVSRDAEDVEIWATAGAPAMAPPVRHGTVNTQGRQLA